jgi:hypothetical protein
MARRTKTLGFSVPFKIAEEFEDLCNRENRSKSDMFREIFQAYKYYILGQREHPVDFSGESKEHLKNSE